MENELIVKKSKLSLGFWTFVIVLLTSFLVFPVIIYLCKIWSISSYSMKINGNQAKIKYGIFNVKEKTVQIGTVLSVDIDKTLIGSIANYGTVKINFAGTHADMIIEGVKRPNELKEYLETLIKNQPKPTEFIAG